MRVEKKKSPTRPFAQPKPTQPPRAQREVVRAAKTGAVRSGYRRKGK